MNKVCVSFLFVFVVLCASAATPAVSRLNAKSANDLSGKVENRLFGKNASTGNRPHTFQCGKIGVMYLHPDEIFIEQQTLNPFSNRRFDLEFRLAELLESEFAAILNASFGVEVFTSEDFGFRPILGYGPVNDTASVGYKKLGERMDALGCCAVILIRSSSQHSNLIGYESEGVGFIKSRLLFEKKPKFLFDARLVVQVFAASHRNYPRRYDPKAVYGGRLLEIELASEEWPSQKRGIEEFLNESRRTWLADQLRSSAEILVQQL